MPCFSPLQAKFKILPSGKKSVSFSSSNSKLFIKGLKLMGDDNLTLPCGQCIGCRLERSRQWAVRCMHEASLYERNCFVTLTYDNEHLPKDRSLNKKHFQDFMKRLRFCFPDDKVRYYHCGEYGERFSRPHYHIILFNFDFDDRVLWKESSGCKLYTSNILAQVWGKGFCTVGDVTFESAAYCSRYVTKKVTGKAAADHYQGRQPEYNTMSRRPGIARDWYLKYRTDVFPSDEVIVNGVSCSPPRYYSNLYEIECPEDFLIVKQLRKEQQEDMFEDSTYARLKDRELCVVSKMDNFNRSYEQGY